MGSFPRGQALVIGVGDYGDPRWNAPPAARDARSIYGTLTNADLGGYDRGKAELLLDHEATREGVLAALKRLANRSNEQSVALISFTGHGATGDDGLYYLATHGTKFTPAPREQVVGGTALSIAELARALRDIPARQLLLVVNACFSGGIGAQFAGGAISPDAPASGQMLTDEAGNQVLASGEGRAIITASRPEQRSYFQPSEQHTYFGQAMLDALHGSAASAASGVVSIYELYNNLYRQVGDVTERRLGTRQEPILTLLQNAGPFPVASYPSSGGRSDPIPADRAQGPVRVVERDVIQAIGQGATAIKAEAGSNVTVDNSKLIDFGSATVMGGINIGNVAKGDIINIGGSSSGSAEQPPDPRRDLPLLRARVSVARNVDEEARDEATDKLDLAISDLGRGDNAKARRRVEQALAILNAMDNGYVRSITRKLEVLKGLL